MLIRLPFRCSRVMSTYASQQEQPDKGLTREAFRAKTAGVGFLMKPLVVNKAVVDQLAPDTPLVLTHTNLLISFSSVFEFWSDNSGVIRQIGALAKDPESGHVMDTAMTRPWNGNFETITVFRDYKSLARFYAGQGGAHAEVMKKWRPRLTRYSDSDIIKYRVTLADLPIGKSRNDLNAFWARVKQGGFPEWSSK